MCTYVYLLENLSAARGPGLCFVLLYIKFCLIKFLKYYVVSLYLWDFGPLIFSFHQNKQMPNNHNVFTHYVWTTAYYFVPEEYSFINALDINVFSGFLDGKHKVPDTSFLDTIPGLSSVFHGIFGWEKTILNLRHLNLFNSFLGVSKKEVTTYS